MNAEEKVSWLNEHDLQRRLRVGDEVRCCGCGAVFKAEWTAMDHVGEPTCPHCIGSTPADFERLFPDHPAPERRCMICGVVVSKCCC